MQQPAPPPQPSTAPQAPLRYRIDLARGLLTVELLDLDAVDVVITAITAIAEDPAYTPDLHVCIDCRGLRCMPGVLVVEELAARYLIDVAYDLTGRRALVAPEGLLHELARLFAALGSTRTAPVRVFRALNEALAYLLPEWGQTEASSQTRWISQARPMRAVVPRPNEA